MLVLDTDHLSELERGSQAGERLYGRLDASDLDKALTIISVEEQIRGWLAEISRRADPQSQITPYAKFQRQIEVFNDWIVLPWSQDAAQLFGILRRQGVRIGSMDLKIACIALVHNAILLTRNTHDFTKIPGLRTENWLS